MEQNYVTVTLCKDVAILWDVESRDETGSYFVTQRPSDPEIQKPGDSVDPVTLFYNELQMSKKYSQAEEFLIIIGKSTSSLHGLTSSDFSPTTDT